MKKQYIFIFLIGIILCILYFILSFTYERYKVNKKMENMMITIAQMKEEIKEAKKIVTYKTSRAFKNKILKEQQSYKNKKEVIKSFTSEKQFNKYTKPLSEINQEVKQLEIIEKNEIYEMDIYERWMYFLFDKNS